jgi:hypothetical protein
MRGKTVSFEGPAAVWGPGSQEEFKAIAGDRFLGTDGDAALVRAADGGVERALPGWVAIGVERADGEEVPPGDVVFASASRAVLSQ